MFLDFILSKTIFNIIYALIVSCGVLFQKTGNFKVQLQENHDFFTCNFLRIRVPLMIIFSPISGVSLLIY